jgi:hypothetical protein
MISRIELVVVEGDLEAEVARKLLGRLGIEFSEQTIINKHGRTNFWPAVRRYNEVARRLGPVLALADLEGKPCAPALFERYLPTGRHAAFHCRLAVPMLESWLLADAERFARFVGAPPDIIPRNPELEVHPKLTIVNLARRYAPRELRADLVPPAGSRGVEGPGYRDRMACFVRDAWEPLEAGRRSRSLDRALHALGRRPGA